MTDAPTPEAAAAAWMKLIAARGWRGADAAEAADGAGLPPEELVRLAGDKVDALAAFQDRLAAEAAAGAAGAMGSVRERLFDGLMRGFDLLQAERAAVLAIWRSRDPGVALLLGGRAGPHVRRLATAAGIPVGGVRGQLRVAALGALCLAAFRAWERDETPDMAATMAELDRLLERAERAETEGFSPDLLGLPGLSALFRRFRAPPRGSGDQVPAPSPDPRSE